MVIENNDVFYSEQNLQATANLQATYTYTPVSTRGGVPEPATWAMMLLGLSGAGAVLRGARGKSAAAA